MGKVTLVGFSFKDVFGTMDEKVYDFTTLNG